MTMTNEEIKKILDGAPEGATHYQSTTYLRYDSKSWLWWSEAVSRWCFVRDESIGWAQILSGHHGNLSDLREILELRQEVERLSHENQRLVAASYGIKLINPKFTPRAMTDDELVGCSKLREQDHE